MFIMIIGVSDLNSECNPSGTDRRTVLITGSAIATAGLLVVDIDSKDNKWLANEPDKLTALVCAPLSLTANGGKHDAVPERFRWDPLADFHVSFIRLKPA